LTALLDAADSDHWEVFHKFLKNRAHVCVCVCVCVCMCVCLCVCVCVFFFKYGFIACSITAVILQAIHN
jgi:hypothetical protein